MSASPPPSQQHQMQPPASLLGGRCSPPHLSALDPLPFPLAATGGSHGGGGGSTPPPPSPATQAPTAAPSPHQQRRRQTEGAQASDPPLLQLPGSSPPPSLASLQQLRSELSAAAAALPSSLDGLLSGQWHQAAPIGSPPGLRNEEQRQDQQQQLQQQASMSLVEWEVAPSEIEICRRPDGSLWQCGAGGYGRVYKAMRFGVQPVAVKVLAPAAEARYSMVAGFKREVQLLKACKDPNIVSFLGASLAGDFTMLVTEYCDGGSLSANLMSGRVSWYKRGKQIALDVARGLTYLHSRRVIHFDLKSPNILLDRHGTAKIADVGLAKIISQELSAVSGNMGTLSWAAPEMLLGQRCTEKADIYSFGVVLWEVCTGAVPSRGRMRPLVAPGDCPAELAALVDECMEADPAARPSAQQLVQRLCQVPGVRAQAPPPAAAAANVAAAAAAVAGQLVQRLLPGSGVGSSDGGGNGSRPRQQPLAAGKGAAAAAAAAGVLPPRPGSLLSLLSLHALAGGQPLEAAEQPRHAGSLPLPEKAPLSPMRGAAEPAGHQPSSAPPPAGAAAAAAAGTAAHGFARAASTPAPHVHGDVYGLGMF